MTSKADKCSVYCEWKLLCFSIFQMVLHLDCSAAISKICGKYPGPLAELEVSVILNFVTLLKKELRKKKKKKASREDRTPDPWFTRPVLYH